MNTTTVDELQKNLDFFISNQKCLNDQHNGKVLLIYHQKVVGAFNDYSSAYFAAYDKYTPGEYSLISCLPGPEAYTISFGNLSHYVKPVEA